MGDKDYAEKISAIRVICGKEFPPMKTTKAVEICPALAAALKAKPAVRKIFESMPPSHQREYNKWVAEAKKEETQQRRAEGAVEKIGQWKK